jgi:hypothetical protein
MIELPENKAIPMQAKHLVAGNMSRLVLCTAADSSMPITEFLLIDPGLFLGSIRTFIPQCVKVF